MSANTIDAQMLARMFLSGARNLENQRAECFPRTGW